MILHPPSTTLFPYTTLFRSLVSLSARAGDGSTVDGLLALLDEHESGGKQFHLDVPRLVLVRSEEHTSELQSHSDLVCRLLLEKKKTNNVQNIYKANT